MKSKKVQSTVGAVHSVASLLEILPGVSRTPLPEKFLPQLCAHFGAALEENEAALLRAGLDPQRKEEQRVEIKNALKAKSADVARLVRQAARVQRDLIVTLGVLLAEGKVKELPLALRKAGAALDSAPLAVRWLNAVLALVVPHAPVVKSRFGKDVLAEMSALRADLQTEMKARQRLVAQLVKLTSRGRAVAGAIARVLLNVRAIASRAFVAEPEILARFRWPKLRRPKRQETPQPAKANGEAAAHANGEVAANANGEAAAKANGEAAAKTNGEPGASPEPAPAGFAESGAANDAAPQASAQSTKSEAPHEAESQTALAQNLG